MTKPKKAATPEPKPKRTKKAATKSTAKASTSADKPARTKALKSANTAIVQVNGRRATHPDRSPVYTPQLADEICRRLSEGETLSSICRTKGFPSKGTVIAWSLETAHPFAERYAKAREAGYHVLADEILDIANDTSRDITVRPDGTFQVDHEHINRSRLKFDARKWILSKMLPRVFSDRVALTGENGGPLQFTFLPGDENL